MAERMRVLVAYDGSDCADAALTDLQRAGLPREVEALVFTVGEAFLPPPPVLSYEAVAVAAASRRVSSALAQSRTQAAHALEAAREEERATRRTLRPARRAAPSLRQVR